MIVRARVVVTMDGPPIENGAVVIRGDRIVGVGTFAEVAKGNSAERVVDLGEQVLLPGLINAHCHLDYTCLRGKISRQKSFTDWIRAINAAKANLEAKDYHASINEGFSEAKRFGTTTIANLTAFPELVSQIEPRIRTWWFAELIDVRGGMTDENLNAICIRVAKADSSWGLAPHAPFTASANLYRRCEDIARREGIVLTTHLAESREERRMFQEASGSLYEFLKSIGRDMSDCGMATPTERFTEMLRDPSHSVRFARKMAASPQSIGCKVTGPVGMTSRWMLVHLNELSEGDFDLLRQSAQTFSVIHCPRSHEYFQHSPFQFQKLRDAGLNICLGTDSLASNEDLSLFAEMRAFQKQFPSVGPAEILEMTTTNSARALGQESGLGRIRDGFFADLIALPMEKSTSIFDRIIAFDDAVTWSMLGGEVLP